MTPLQLTRSVRGLTRLQQIARVLTQHGFGHVVDRLNLGRFVPLLKLRKHRARLEGLDSGAAAIGRRITRVCNELGPSFVKLGQLLTTRPDLIPQDTLRELRNLQDRVEPFDSALAHRIIETELGSPIDELYSCIDEAPFASGSIAQVYRATTHDGMQVVVKVKRPDIEHVVALDLQILAWAAEAAERFLPEMHVYHPVQLVQEFGEALRREMDFVNEASVTTRLQRAFAEDPHVRVPHVRWDLCGGRVLTLEEMRGQNLDLVLSSETDRLDRKALASRLADAYLKQFFEVGIFHADPHPGNILVTPPATIRLIDFGQVGVLSDELATQFLILILAAINREPDVIVDVLDELDALGRKTDRQRVARALRMLLDKYHGLPLKRLDPFQIFLEGTDILRANDVTIPRNLVVLIKALTTVVSVGMKLDPELNLVALLKPRMRQMVADRLSPPRLAKAAGITLWQAFGILRSAPRQIQAVLRRIARGQWELNVRHENLDRLVNELDRSSNRLAFSIVIAAIIVGSSVVITTQENFQLLGPITLRTLGVFGYIVAGVLGLGLVWAIFRSGRLS